MRDSVLPIASSATHLPAIVFSQQVSNEASFFHTELGDVYIPMVLGWYGFKGETPYSAAETSNIRTLVLKNFLIVSQPNIP